jgi:TP53 regulating kinase-like protein
MMYNKRLLKKGAESELYLTNWYGMEAVSKIRLPKKYRHPIIDFNLRKHRTFQEARIMSFVKTFGVRSPFIYMLDLNNFEIIMEFIAGDVLKDVLSPVLSTRLGEIIAKLHFNNIIHGDVTTSNFIFTQCNDLAVIDFGLSFYSERYEDKAADVRLFKEILNSAHVDLSETSFECFWQGYEKTYGKKSPRILDSVREIEKRGRYSRSVL